MQNKHGVQVWSYSDSHFNLSFFHSVNIEPSKKVVLGSKKHIVYSYAVAFCIDGKMGGEKFEKEQRTISRWRANDSFKWP